MGDPARQLANSFHFLGLAELFFNLSLVGNVLGDPSHTVNLAGCI